MQLLLCLNYFAEFNFPVTVTFQPFSLFIKDSKNVQNEN